MDKSKPQAETANPLLTVEDKALRLRDEFRPIRFALKYLKASLRDWGVRSTIIVLGSSRIPPPEQAERAVAEAADDAGGVVGEAYWRRIVTSRRRPPRA